MRNTQHKTRHEPAPDEKIEVTAGSRGFYTQDRLFIPPGARTTVMFRETKALFASGAIIDFRRA